MATESFEDLIVGVLDAGNGEDAYWTVVDVLGRRADEETLHAAIELTHSASPPRRQIGVDILATLGPPQRGPVPPPRPFLETVLPVLLHLGEVEPDAAVMDSVVSALRHQHDPRALSGVLAQVRHVAAEVRLRVAMVLPDCVADRADPPEPVVAALQVLMSDVDKVVRDWATFGLGTMLDVDTPGIRQALLARTTDPDDLTAGEALRALAARGDHRITAALLDRLARTATGQADPNAAGMCLEAAARLGEPALLPFLVMHHRRRNADENYLGYLDSAIDACGRDRILGAVAKTFGDAARLHRYEAGDHHHVDLIAPEDGRVLHRRYSTASTGVLAGLLAEQRWLTERVAGEPPSERDVLAWARQRLDAMFPDNPSEAP